MSSTSEQSPSLGEGQQSPSNPSSGLLLNSDSHGSGTSGVSNTATGLASTSFDSAYDKTVKVTNKQSDHHNRVPSVMDIFDTTSSGMDNNNSNNKGIYGHRTISSLGTSDLSSNNSPTLTTHHNHDTTATHDISITTAIGGQHATPGHATNIKEGHYVVQGMELPHFLSSSSSDEASGIAEPNSFSSSNQNHYYESTVNPEIPPLAAPPEPGVPPTRIISGSGILKKKLAEHSLLTQSSSSNSTASTPGDGGGGGGDISAVAAAAVTQFQRLAGGGNNGESVLLPPLAPRRDGDKSMRGFVDPAMLPAHKPPSGQNRPPAINLHKRNVSWGIRQEHLLGMVVEPNKNSPKLSPLATTPTASYHDGRNSLEGFSLTMPTLGRQISSQTSTSRLTNTSNGSSSNNGIELKDIIATNPLESEAETHIMNVIEAQEQFNRFRANTLDSTSLLGTVPDAAMDVFRVEDNNSSSPPSQTIGRPQHLRTESRAFSTATARSTLEALKDEQPIPTHRRTRTMEHTLQGLTTALHALNAFDHVAEHNPNSLRKSDKIDGLPAAADKSSGDHLLEKAHMIFRGNRKRTDSTADSNKKTDHDSVISSDAGAGSVSRTDGNGTNTTAATNWKMLKHAIHASKLLDTSVKKKDEDNSVTFADGPSPRIGQPDEEVGFAQSLSDCPDDGREGRNGNQDLEALSMRKFRKSTYSRTLKGMGVSLATDVQSFFRQKKAMFIAYCKVLFLVIVPSTGVAALLFHLLGNPPTGIIDLEKSVNGTLVNKAGEIISPNRASASWWLLFCIRQLIVFSMSQALQLFIIDFLCLSTRFAVRLLGQFITLLVVMSRGWPFLFTMWSLLNFGLLSGNHAFVKHWLYWQDALQMMNQHNPSGLVTNSVWNHRILSIALSVGLVVSVKRFWFGIMLSKKTYIHYAEDLTKIMEKILLLSQIASFARLVAFEAYTKEPLIDTGGDFPVGISPEAMDALLRADEAESNEGGEVQTSRELPETMSQPEPAQSGLIIDLSEPSGPGGGLSSAQKSKVTELLGSWEDPDLERAVEEDISISAILQFRQSLSFLASRTMFSLAWGDVSSRENMILSSQKVYQRLMLRNAPYLDVLNFDIIAMAAVDENGTLDQGKLKQMVKLIRPDRDGRLTLLDFVKSVDAVYKDAKMLRASILNNEKIDRAFEKIINVVFYIFLACVILGQIGYNPKAIFLTMSSIILAFAFMIGAASSKYFEGLLFILLRRPYDIGDRINVAHNESEAKSDGSAGWIVKDATLFTTTVVYAATNERATMQNGAMASSRIINLSRSPNACLYIYLKFPTFTEYHKIQIFEEALRRFVKARPRDWAKFSGFRAKQIMSDLGYVVLQHREAWDHLVPLLVSKAEVSSFCLELAKKMGMHYQSPPLPVNLSIVNTGTSQSVTEKLAGFGEESPDLNAVAAMFDKKEE